MTDVTRDWGDAPVTFEDVEREQLRAMYRTSVAERFKAADELVRIVAVMGRWPDYLKQRERERA